MHHRRLVMIGVLFLVLGFSSVSCAQVTAKKQKIEKEHDLVAWSGKQTFKDNAIRVLVAILKEGADFEEYERRFGEFADHKKEIDKHGIDLSKPIKFGLIENTEKTDHTVFFYVAQDFPSEVSFQNIKEDKFINGGKENEDKDRYPKLTKKRFDKWKFKSLGGNKYLITYGTRALDAGPEGKYVYTYHKIDEKNKNQIWHLKRVFYKDELLFKFENKKKGIFLDAGQKTKVKMHPLKVDNNDNNEWQLWRIR